MVHSIDLIQGLFSLLRCGRKKSLGTSFAFYQRKVKTASTKTSSAARSTRTSVYPMRRSFLTKRGTCLKELGLLTRLTIQRRNIGLGRSFGAQYVFFLLRASCSHSANLRRQEQEIYG